MRIGTDKSADSTVVDPAVHMDEIPKLFDMFMTGIASVGIGSNLDSVVLDILDTCQTIRIQIFETLFMIYGILLS